MQDEGLIKKQDPFLSAPNCASQMFAVLHGAIATCHCLLLLGEWVSRLWGEMERLHFESISSHELESSAIFSSIHLPIRKAGIRGCYEGSHLIHTLLIKANP